MSTSHHPIVAREQWLAQRQALLAREKELSRLHDRLAAERRALPWVRVERHHDRYEPAPPVAACRAGHG